MSQYFQHKQKKILLFLVNVVRPYNTMAQIIWSRGRPVDFIKDVPLILQDVQQDSTSRPLEFCKFASNDLELLISSRNAIKNFAGHPVEILLDVHQNLQDVQQNCSTGRPLEQKIWRISYLVYFLDGRILGGGVPHKICRQPNLTLF